MPTVDGFIKHVRVVTAKAHNLLFQAFTGFSHQIPIALVPQFVSMHERARNPATRRFDNMLGHGIGIERRQLTVPVDCLVPGDAY
jgi:hypothetical protein